MSFTVEESEYQTGEVISVEVIPLEVTGYTKTDDSDSKAHTFPLALQISVCIIY